MNSRLWPLLPATQRPQRPLEQDQMLVRGGRLGLQAPCGVLTNPITSLRPPCFSVAAVLILSTPRESKSGWDTWSSWVNRQDVYCPQGVWDKAHVTHKNVDRPGRLLPGQFCSHCFAAMENWPLTRPSCFWKEERKGEEMSFIRHLLCAPHRCGHVCQAFLFTPVLMSQTLGDLLKANLQKCQSQDHTEAQAFYPTAKHGFHGRTERPSFPPSHSTRGVSGGQARDRAAGRQHC